MSTVTEMETPGGSHGRAGRRAALIIVAIVVVLALVGIGGSVAYAKQYDGKALPGTTVLGQDVAGQSPAQIADLVTTHAEAVTVTVTTNGEAREATLADLGVSVDAQATAAKAADHSGDVVNTVKSAFDGTRTIEPVVSVDSAVAGQYAKSLVSDEDAAATDAQVVYDEDAKTWSVEPGKAGQGVDPAAFVEAVSTQAPALKSFSIEQQTQEVQPAISDEAAQQAVDTIEQRLDQTVIVTSANGKSYEASKKTRGDWYSPVLNEAGDGYDVKVDDSKVADWVSGRAEKVSVEPVDGIEQVDDAGNVTKVISEKKDGSEVSNADAVTQQIVTGLNEGSNVEASFETAPVAAKVTKAKTPTASTDSSTTATAEPTGEKWIDVNLSDKTLTAYVGETPVYGPKKIVDGKKGYETVTGTFHIYNRLEKQDMTNASKYPESDSRYYYTKDVPWVQYFEGGYAIHGAPWRSSFGYSGSHGCVNMRPSEAKWVYNWASMGTKVVVHY
ncbi:L,D-transpeptidase/peptidoglycan binding protein [Brachybacterium huguangmaarense]|uniref:L,D-transpeptidase/peptidoglycan binding protein n=1 Tax=Brachybacterium huguangmaarense TaxID=1652028 RepID=A0ABY6FX78_9MICO|nr:L,D-transpeptidase family protein [Brachybacterium huguangmaarense]UYG15522.1 L,D-transpeptidase/peptidoglycan binding protein [Brachybacterium huguangmaarense]